MAQRLVGVAAGLTAVVIGCALLSAQSPAGAAGHWEGTLQMPGQELKIAVDLKGDGKTWQGAIDVPAQNLKGFPLADIATQGDTVTFVMKGVPGNPTFKGTVSKDGKSIAGDFTQGGGTIPFSLTRTGDAKLEPPEKSTPITADLQGSWEGSLDVQGTVLRLVVKLANQSDGTGGGTMVSVDQGGAEIPITTVIQNGTHLKLVLKPIVGTYEGDLKEGQLTGTWTQGPGSWPLVLKRTK